MAAFSSLCGRIGLVATNVALALGLGAPAGAADHQAQFWLTGAAKFDIAERWTASFEAQGRYGDTFERLVQARIGAGADYALNSRATLGGGYYFINSDKNNAPDKREHRFWQHVNWRVGEIGNASMASRSRIEERMRESEPVTAWRIRQSLKLTSPLRDGAKTSLYGGGEVILNLNETTWAGDDGLDEFRFFTGVATPISKSVKADFGYLARFNPRDEAEMRITHNVMLTFTVRP